MPEAGCVYGSTEVYLEHKEVDLPTLKDPCHYQFCLDNILFHSMPHKLLKEEQASYL